MKEARRAAIVVGLGAAFVWWAIIFVFGGVESHALETGCTALVEGDDVETVVATLGITGYQPGCDAHGAGPSAGLPCTRGDFGAIVAFPYLCERDDCSLYWRIADVACLVELDPQSMRVTSAAFMPLGAAAESAE